MTSGMYGFNNPPSPIKTPANAPQRRAFVSVKVVVNLVGKAHALLLET